MHLVLDRVRGIIPVSKRDRRSQRIAPGHLGADVVPATLRVGAQADLFAWKRGLLTADLDGVLR